MAQIPSATSTARCADLRPLDGLVRTHHRREMSELDPSVRASLHVLAARHALGFLPSEEMPLVAVGLLEADVDSEAFANLAGGTRLDRDTTRRMRDRLHEVLLLERVVLLDAPITDDLANIAIAKLLFLDSENPTTPAHLLLDTPGGQVSAALAIRDTIDEVSCPVHVHALRQVAGVAVLLLAHGVRGARVASPNTVVQLTAISSSDGAASSSELERTEAIVAEMLASDTGQAFEKILKDMRGLRSFVVDEAREYGFVDRIAEPPWPAVREQSRKIN